MVSVSDRPLSKSGARLRTAVWSSLAFTGSPRPPRIPVWLPSLVLGSILLANYDSKRANQTLSMQASELFHEWAAESCPCHAGLEKRPLRWLLQAISKSAQ